MVAIFLLVKLLFHCCQFCLSSSVSGSVLDFQKKMLELAGPQVLIFGCQNKYSSRQKLYLRMNRIEYNKLNIFYLALTEKECFRLPLNFL